MKERASRNHILKRHRKLLIVLIVLTAVSAGVYLKMSSSSRTDAKEQVQTQKATKGNIKETVEGSGSVASAATQTVTFSNDVVVQSIKKNSGSSVKKGDTIMVLTSSATEDAISNLKSQISTLETSLSSGGDSASTEITAKVSGRVKRIYAQDDTLVSKIMNQDGALMEIAADGKLKVEFTPTRNVKTGDAVTVDFDGYSISTKIADMKSGKAIVRISDNYYYNVDTKVTIYNNNKVKIGSGKLKSNAPIRVTGDTGTIDSVDVSINEKVAVGDTLISLTGVGYDSTYKSNLEKYESLTDQLEALNVEKNSLTVTAKYDGVISQMDVSQGDTVSKGKTLCVVSGTNAFNVSIDVDELDITSVKKGQSTTVTADAVEGKTFKGTVTKVSKVGTNTDGVATYPVTIELEDGKGLLSAMSATATITTKTANNAILVPVSAIQTKDSKNYVTIVANGDDTGTSKEVKVGIINNTYAQIVSGVSEGDQVQIITRSTTNKNQKPQDGAMGSGMNGRGSGSGMGSGQRPSN